MAEQNDPKAKAQEAWDDSVLDEYPTIEEEIEASCPTCGFINGCNCDPHPVGSDN